MKDQMEKFLKMKEEQDQNQDKPKDKNAKKPKVTTTILDTMGKYSQSILKGLTQQDFKADKQAWRKWIEKNVEDKLSNRDVLLFTTRRNSK